MFNKWIIQLCMLALCLGISAAANATYHFWRITQLYSSTDGTVQFIEITALASGQQYIDGHTITSSQGGNTHSFTFPTMLPDDSATTMDGYYGSSTSYKSFVIGTQGFASLGVVMPDYVVPDGFLFTENGVVNYGESSDIFSYTSLPTDGRRALYRDGSTGVNSAQNFAGQMATISVAVVPGVTEFYNTTLNHYFLTANPIEGTSIDAGGSGPGWTRTGNVFKTGGPNVVCRFFGVQSAGGPNGHFYTADPLECAQVKLDPGWHFESLDFATAPVGPGGTCTAGLVPVYRAYNHRFAQQDSNHRITANFAAYQHQVDVEGWTGEGVVMCAQP